MPKVYLRKRQVEQRYGGITPRSVERAVKDGRLPPPEFPFGARIPMWDEAKLEVHERAAAMRGKSRQVNIAATEIKPTAA
jgi:hypothetical protein